MSCDFSKQGLPCQECGPFGQCLIPRPPKLIAVDFDGTLCENAYPAIGKPMQSTVDALRAEIAAGAKWILWTCREGDELIVAVHWCHEHELYPNAVNENLPERTAFYGNDCRKVGADEYWDDRARRMPERVCGFEIVPEETTEIYAASIPHIVFSCGYRIRGMPPKWKHCPSCGAEIRIKDKRQVNGDD